MEARRWGRPCHLGLEHRPALPLVLKDAASRGGGGKQRKRVSMPTVGDLDGMTNFPQLGGEADVCHLDSSSGGLDEDELAEQPARQRG